MNIQPIPLSPSGPLISPIVLGVMKWGVWGRRLDTAQMLRLMEESVELGITTFDHADIYGGYTTEAEFGEALKLRPQLRQRIQIITKCGICLMTPNRPQHKLKSYNTSALHIRRSVEQSLRNLHTDYLDVLLIHRPDPLLHPDEVAGIFQTLQQEGKVQHFGVSNFSPSQMEVLQTKFPLVTNQVKASAMHLEPFTDGTFDQCLRYGIRPTAWSPLGGERFFTEPDDPQVARIRRACAAIAASHGSVGEDQIMLAFLLRHPAGIVPVIGTANTARVRAAAEALRIPLTREEWFEIWSASTGTEVD
jgi:predicted oxidoreductase